MQVIEQELETGELGGRLPGGENIKGLAKTVVRREERNLKWRSTSSQKAL